MSDTKDLKCPRCNYSITTKIREQLLDIRDEKLQKALDLLVKFGSVDGSHHKAWVIDQVTHILTEDLYKKFVAMAKDGEDGPETYTWDTGIAP